MHGVLRMVATGCSSGWRRVLHHADCYFLRGITPSTAGTACCRDLLRLPCALFSGMNYAEGDVARAVGIEGQGHCLRLAGDPVNLPAGRIQAFRWRPCCLGLIQAHVFSRCGALGTRLLLVDFLLVRHFVHSSLAGGLGCVF